MLHEAYGLNDDIRAWADRFAAEGYLALAPDLYAWGSTARCLVASFRSLMSGSGRAFDDIEAARRAVAERDDCTGRIGVIGFCMGGGFALLAAPRFGFAAAAPNYGLVPKDAESALAGSCPIVGSYGGRDRYLRGHAARLESTLTTLGVEHDVKEYAAASHGFLNTHEHGLAHVINRIMRSGYHGPSADDATRRILAFFDQHLTTG